MALLLLLAGCVCILTLLFALNRMLSESRARPVTVQVASSAPGRVQEFKRDLETPGDVEIFQPSEPEFHSTLTLVMNAAAALAVTHESLGPGRSFKTGRTGKSNERDKESASPIEDSIVPRWKRWQVRYLSNHISLYAQQLDFFEIELGAVGGVPNIDYARNLQNSRPNRRQGPGSTEKRLYLSWLSGDLKRFDRELLERAGINTHNRMLLQFYPQRIEDQLAWTEMAHAKQRGHSRVQEILRTFFGVRPIERGYEFYVMDQLFRPAPSSSGRENEPSLQPRNSEHGPAVRS